MAIADASDATDERFRHRGHTTIELSRSERGRWLATQRDVDVEGYGETAAEAAAAYCRRVVAQNE